jgi:glycosyltransferase involved in cell wall biosynthesis
MAVVGFVVPALNEADYIAATLRSIEAQTRSAAEVVVVNGGSVDGTRAIAREHGARVVEQDGRGIGPARNLGARAVDGDWLAFVDADTRLEEEWLGTLLDFVRREDLAAAASRCRVVDGYRGKAMQVVVNRVFPHLSRPVLPGFGMLVRRDAFEAVGGYPEVPNEDTAFSRRLGREYPTAYHPDVLVETSGRRFDDQGLTGALVHYLALDWRRVRADY